MDRQLSSALSLCMRAGGVKTGGFACEKAVQSGKALLIVVSAQASGNTKKRFSQKAFHYKVPYREALGKDELGRAIGKDGTAVMAITNGNFSGRILKLIDAELNNDTANGAEKH